MSKQHEYAFDATLKAVLRVKAATEAEARELIQANVDGTCASKLPGKIKLTEFSVTEQEPTLFQVDSIDSSLSCDGCGGPYSEFGDGYCGLCPDCADAKEAA